MDQQDNHGHQHRPADESGHDHNLRVRELAADPNMYINTNSYLSAIPVESSVTYQDGAGKTFKTVYKAWQNSHVMAAEQNILYDAAGSVSVGNARVFAHNGNEQVTGVFECGFQTEGSIDPSCSGFGNPSYIGPLRRHATTMFFPEITS